MNYTLHQLRIFVKVCEYRSVTRAAEVLYLTQPAISIQLKRLQQQFDMPLTEITGRQLHVTEFGYRIRNLALELLRKADDIQSAADEHRGILTGTIRIASASTGKYVVPYFLADFMRKHPKVAIEVDVTNKSLVVDSLRENTVDFAVVSTVPQTLRVAKLPLLPNELYLTAAAGYPGLPDHMTPKKLSGFPLILREEGSATRRAMEEFLQRKNITASRLLQLNSNEAVKQAVRAGLGLSILPKIGIRGELEAGSLRIIPMHGLPIVTEWTMVYAKGKRLTRAATALLQEVEAVKEKVIAREFAR